MTAKGRKNPGARAYYVHLRISHLEYSIRVLQVLQVTESARTTEEGRKMLDESREILDIIRRGKDYEMSDSDRKNLHRRIHTISKDCGGGSQHGRPPKWRGKRDPKIRRDIRDMMLIRNTKLGLYGDEIS